MDRTITIVLTEGIGNYFFGGLNKNDPAHMTLAIEALRAVTVDLERLLIRRQLIDEQARVSDDPDSTTGGAPDDPTTDRAAGGNGAPEVQGGEANGETGTDTERHN